MGMVVVTDRSWVDQVQFTPSCPVTLLSNTASHPSSVSTGLVSVTAASNCTWNLVNTNTWIALASGMPITGNGTFTYVVTKNSTPNARTGNLRIVDQIFTVTQEGSTNPSPDCAVSISPTNRVHGYSSASNMV